ncbi:hypothetical protein OF83DRAFT_1165502 [Amylostereum chailletii]|nr:hypothetical protein OF83DRAFT_1165502 [Amylostereum chailletii]
MSPANTLEEKDPKEIEAGFVEVPDLQGTSASDSVDGFGPRQTRLQKVTNVLKSWGVEVHGIDPVPEEERTDQRLHQMFFVWLSANFSVLTFSTGTVGPVFYGLGLRDSLLIILNVRDSRLLVPPPLGQSWGRVRWFKPATRGAMIPSILNVFSLQGFLIINTIVGGQTLAAVSSHLNATLGIVIIAVISLVVSFLGYRVLHLYESVAWIPNLVAFLVMLGVGAKDIRNLPPVPPATAASVLTYGSIVFVSVLSWCTMTPDYGVHHSPKSASAYKSLTVRVRHTH